MPHLTPVSLSGLLRFLELPPPHQTRDGVVAGMGLSTGDIMGLWRKSSSWFRLGLFASALEGQRLSLVTWMTERTGQAALDRTLALPNGITALVLAARKNQPALCRVLLASGANPNAHSFSSIEGPEGVNRTFHFIPLLVLLQYAPDPEVVDVFEHHGCTHLHTPPTGIALDVHQTQLMRCVLDHRSPALLTRLLQSGLSPDALVRQQTPLQIIGRNSVNPLTENPLVDRLLEAGAHLSTEPGPSLDLPSNRNALYPDWFCQKIEQERARREQAHLSNLLGAALPADEDTPPPRRVL